MSERIASAKIRAEAINKEGKKSLDLVSKNYKKIKKKSIVKRKKN